MLLQIILQSFKIAVLTSLSQTKMIDFDVAMNGIQIAELLLALLALERLEVGAGFDHERFHV